MHRIKVVISEAMKSSVVILEVIRSFRKSDLCVLPQGVGGGGWCSQDPMLMPIHGKRKINFQL
jgi:hypothetical protein